jgi:FSR family fosmidomycin resistance protein-like MFS transporter
VFVGLLVDRRPLAWLAGAGVALAGVGAGLSGLAPAYAMTWVLLLLSGVGVAMFHPAAGAGARVAAGESASAMSVFATGGSIGFFLAPLLVAPVLAGWGIGATVVFVPPALIAGFALIRRERRVAPAPGREPPGPTAGRPGRPGTVSGVTLGLAVSVGGLSAPIFGAIAQQHGTAALFSTLCVVPVLAVAAVLFLPQPAPAVAPAPRLSRPPSEPAPV